MTTLLLQNILIAAIAATLLLKSGSKKEPMQFRGVASKIVIKSPSTSPALAAYKDLYDPILINQVDPKKQIPVQLVAGNKSFQWQKYQSEPAAVAYLPKLSASSYKELSGIRFAKSEGHVLASAESGLLSTRAAGYNVWTKKHSNSSAHVRSVSTSINKRIVVVNNSPTKAPDDKIYKPKTRVDDNFTAASVDVPLEEEVRVEGSVEFAHGLALVDEYSTLSVIYNYAGVDRETVNVDVMTGEFKLKLSKWGGVLYAEMRDRFGHLRGLGEINLLDMSSKLSSKISIKVNPVDTKIHAVVASGYSYDKDIKVVSGAEVTISRSEKPIITNKKGEFFVENNLPGSSDLVTIKKSGFWPTVANLTSYKRNVFKLHSKSYVDSLLKLSFDDMFYENASRMGILLGKVTLNGKDLPDAEVEISTDTSQPVYFNSFLPDVTLKKTTTNGQFAIFMLDEGVHALRIKYDGKFFPAEVVPVKYGHITQLNIDIRPEATSEILITDHSSGRGVDANISLEGQERITTAHLGEAQIRFTSSQSFLELIIRENVQYPAYRTKLFKQEYFKRISILKKSDFRSLIDDIDNYVAQGKSIYYGAVLNDSYEVSIESEESFEFKVIYFDKDLKRVTSGVPGGGYIIIADTQGVAELQVQGMSTDNIYREFIGQNSESVGLSLIDFSTAFN